MALTQDTNAEQSHQVERLVDRADADQARLLDPDGRLVQLAQRVLNRTLDAEFAGGIASPFRPRTRGSPSRTRPRWLRARWTRRSRN